MSIPSQELGIFTAFYKLILLKITLFQPGLKITSVSQCSFAIFIKKPNQIKRTNQQRNLPTISLINSCGFAKINVVYCLSMQSMGRDRFLQKTSHSTNNSSHSIDRCTWVRLAEDVLRLCCYSLTSMENENRRRILFLSPTIL